MKILHISDLHFTSGSHRGAAAQSHSVPHLIGLAARVSEIQPDWAIVSGDITNDGEAESLLRARDYLFHGLSIGGGQRIGLGLDPASTFLVPGNHDAWNGGRVGGVELRLQKSLANFNDVFHEFEIDANMPIRWKWIPLAESGLFVCTVSSCFLGDPELPNGDSVAGGSPIDWVARGKLSVRQSRELLELCDRGFLGRLGLPGDGRPISATAFAHALKIVVMHHYVFEAPLSSRQRLLELRERNTVFANQAMAGFDLLVCGHKHENHISSHVIGDHLDRKARRRLAINLFRRMLGIQAIPLQMHDRGKMFARPLKRLVQLLWARRQREMFETRSDTELLVHTLRMSIEHPEILNNQLARWISLSGDEWPQITQQELDDISARLRQEFSVSQRAKLADYARSMERILMRFQQRSFVQSMCGSTTKQPGLGNEKSRSFCVYEVDRVGTRGRWNIRRRSYEFDQQTSAFREEMIDCGFDVRFPLDSGVWQS